MQSSPTRFVLIRVGQAIALAILLGACSQDAAEPTHTPAAPERVAAEAKGAAQWRLMTLRDENGKIPHDAQMKALAEMQTLRTEGTCGGLTAAGWKEEGPGLIGGRVRAIAIDPNNSKRMFCGSVGGGIWYSADAASSWSKVDDHMDNLAVTCILFDPFNSAKMLAATGEGFGNLDAIRGAGIFRSLDSGATWSRLASTNNPDFYYVNRLSLDLTGSNALAATRTGIWHSNDFGTTWTRTNTGSCRDVKFNPNNPRIAIAENDRAPYAHYSTDGGVTWTGCAGLTLGGHQRIEFAWSRGYTGPGNGVVYALKDYAVASNATDSLLRSMDGGATFTLVSENRILGKQGWYNNALWVAPNPKNTYTIDDLVVAGGIDLWRSTDGGGVFTRMSLAYQWPKGPHADQHIILEDPNYDSARNRRVWFGNDGGVWEVGDVGWASPGNGWFRRNVDLGVTQFYGGSTHGSGIVLGGSQDTGTLRRVSGTAYNGWTHQQGGDGGFCASDPTDSNYHYWETQNGALYKSTDGGVSGRSMRTFPGSNFIAPFILDPNNPNTLYFGAGSLWRTTDAKYGWPTWTTIHSFNAVPISAIAVQRGSPDELWVGHNGGFIYHSRDATAATPMFTPKAQRNLPGRMVTRITIDPNNSSHVFACFGGYQSDNVWETTNAGANWTALSGLPSAPVRDLKLSPADSKILYVATEVGLVVSEDGGNTWCSSATPANVAIYEMFWGANNKFYLATHGRGLFSYELGPRGPTCLETTFAGGNGLTSKDCGALFDVTVANPIGLKIVSMDVHSQAVGSTPIGIEVWVTPDGYVGKDNSPGKWVMVSKGTANAAASGRTTVDVDDFYLAPGKYGMYVIHDNGGIHFTDGNGNNQVYSNPDLALSLGAGKAARFTGKVSNPRVWNGAICYDSSDQAANGPYGFGCPGTGAVTPSFSLSAEPRIGSSLSFDVANMTSTSGPAWMFFGLIDNSGVDLSGLGMTNCSLFAFPIILTVPFQNVGGSASLPVTIPNTPALIGGTVGTQVANADAGANSLGAAATAGHAIRIGN
ncbi:MAG: hypothetical protein VX951_00020 [Planctomycetota bacterium]|nr:hypothetical protein [Planctomycetota bacterium]